MSGGAPRRDASEHRFGLLGVLSREAAVPLCALAFAAAYYADTWQLPIQSRIFPYFIFVLLGVLTVAVLVKEIALAWQGIAPADEQEGGRALAKPAVVLGTAAIYAVLIHFAGFVVASAIYLVATMTLLGVPWLRAAIIGIAFTSALYLLFAKLFLVAI